MDMNAARDHNVRKLNKRLSLPSTMRTAGRDFAPRYREPGSIPCEKLLPHDLRLPTAGSAAQSALRVGQSREFMERHLDQPVTIAVLAARAGVSTSHFFKLFKEETGCAPVVLVYMTRLKMERARDWLVTTDWSIKLIAADLGYHDPLYFSRVFKSLIGVAPKTYRRARRNGEARSAR